MRSRIVEVPASGNLPRGVVEEFLPYELYIVTSGGLYGHYGKGATMEEAHKAWRKAGGRKAEGNVHGLRFISRLPFAPFDRAVFLLTLAASTALVERYATMEEMPVAVAAYFDELLGQMEHPQFLDYIRAKLGAL